MSDMRKLLAIIAKSLGDELDSGEPAQVSRSHAGGIGRVDSISPEEGKAVLDVKGNKQEFPVDKISPVANPEDSYYYGSDEDQRYDEIEAGIHCQTDHPELEAGNMVRIVNMYGAGNGDGFGIFVAYSLDGTSAVINIDGADTSVPIEYVSKAPEDECHLCTDANDGTLSPMSYGEENRTDLEIGDNNMDDLERWMRTIEESEFTPEKKEKSKEMDCGCLSYDCQECFPNMNEACGNDHKEEESEEDLEEYASLSVNGDAEQLDELAPLIGAEARGAAMAMGAKATDELMASANPELENGYELEGALDDALISMGYDPADIQDSYEHIIDELDAVGGFDSDGESTMVDQVKLQQLMSKYGIEPMFGSVDEASVDLAPEMGHDSEEDDEEDDMSNRMVDVGDEEDVSGHDEFEVDMGIKGTGEPGDIVDKASFIAQNSDKFFDTDKLLMLPAETIERMYAKMMAQNESVEELPETRKMAEVPPLMEMGEWLKMIEKNSQSDGTNQD